MKKIAIRCVLRCAGAMFTIIVPVPETGDGNILFNRSRLMIGHFLMKPCGRILKCDMRTDIYNAETSGTIITDKGSIRFEVFVHSLDMGIIVKTDASSGENGFTWQWVSDSPNSPRYDKFKAGGNTSKVVREYKENAPAVVDEENRTALFTYLNGRTDCCPLAYFGKRQCPESICDLRPFLS